MKFVKSISLILLFAIFGINGVFAQNNKPSSNWPTLGDKDKLRIIIKEKPELQIPAMEPIPQLLDPTIAPFLKKEDRFQPESTPDIYAPEDLFITYRAPMTSEEIGLKNYYQPRPEDYSFITYQKPLGDQYLLLNIEDAYLVVFGRFGGEGQFFDQYPYDTDFPEEIKYSPLCNYGLWDIIERSYLLDLITGQADFNKQMNCTEFNGLNAFFLFHPTSRDQDEVEAFVIPLKDVRRSRARLLEATSEVQNALDAADSNEYARAVQIRDLMESYLSN